MKTPLYEAGKEALQNLKETIEICRACPDEVDWRALRFEAKLVNLSHNSGHPVAAIEAEAQRISLLGRE